MATTRHTTVDAYIAAQPATARGHLERVRHIIRGAMPDAEETISYSIPAYRIGGRVVLYFAGWREHFSIYPSTDRLVTAFGTDLARYEISKGTIRFPLSAPVPVRLIAKIAKFRVKEASERETRRKAAKATTRKTRRRTREPFSLP